MLQLLRGCLEVLLLLLLLLLVLGYTASHKNISVVSAQEKRAGRLRVQRNERPPLLLLLLLLLLPIVLA